jgi:tRNA G18 (ribose-2'-O)-methylase SpoU
MFRTADAVSAAKIFLTGITATPTHPKVIKTSLGAENFVPWESEDDIDKLIIRLKKVVTR